MEISQQILDAITHYHDSYRHPNLARPIVSDIYALYPDKPSQCGWPKTWPQSDNPGVYLIFDAKMQLLYIGKAAILGKRLSTYFQYTRDSSKSCFVVSSDWKSDPKFLVTVALAKSFEASAMEEYLITELRPPENKHWVTQKANTM